MKRYIRSSDVDDYDEYDPYQGHMYYVSYGYNHKYTDNPKQAITIWFQQAKKNPMDCAIMAKWRKGAVDIVNTATPELLTTLYEKYDCPYKLEYLIEGAEKQRQNGCKYFLENKYGYGDQVEPFSFG